MVKIGYGLARSRERRAEFFCPRLLCDKKDWLVEIQFPYFAKYNLSSRFIRINYYGKILAAYNKTMDRPVLGEKLVGERRYGTCHADKRTDIP